LNAFTDLPQTTRQIFFYIFYHRKKDLSSRFFLAAAELKKPGVPTVFPVCTGNTWKNFLVFVSL